MRWSAFAILIIGVTVLQTTVAPFLAVHTVRPDLMVIVAVFFALAAPKRDAPLACWFVGLAMDLSTASYGKGANVGLHAFVLGLMTLAIVQVRDLIFRDHVLTQLFFTLSAKCVLALAVGFHMMLVRNDWTPIGDVMLTGVYSAVYTAILAPYGHWLLRRLRTVFGIGAAHRIRVH